MKKLITILGIALLVGTGLIAFPQLSSAASIGVSPGIKQPTGPLQPGETYDLGGAVVVNTGDTASGYEVGTAYVHNQPELRPPEEWFTFTPKTFYLEPGQHQYVSVELNIPIDAQPGDYFCFLQFRGGPAVGIKLHFAVESIIISMSSFEVKQLSFSCNDRGDELKMLFGKFTLGEGNNGIDLENDKKILSVGGISIPEEKIRIIKLPGRFGESEQYLLFVREVKKDINGEGVVCPGPGEVEMMLQIGDDVGRTSVGIESSRRGGGLKVVRHNKFLRDDD